jgi:hypothetical protein
MSSSSPDPVQAPEPTASTEKNSHAYPTLAIIIVALFFLAAVGIVSYGPLPQFSNEQESETLGEPLEGLLIMALAVRVDDGTSRISIAPSTYDLMYREVQVTDAAKLAASPDGMNLAYQHIFSPDGNYVTFLGATNVESVTSISQMPLQIYRADVYGAQSYEDFITKIRNAEQMTTDTSMFRQAPSVSNAGYVLYTAHSREAELAVFTAEANEWSVYLVMPGGTDRMLTRGISPKWVAEDMFVFLKNDGLYSYSVTTGVEKKVWGTEGIVTAISSLEVSDDYQHIAWLAPESGYVTLLRALNWDTGVLEEKGFIPSPGIAAVFSPDSRFIAVQELVENESSATGIQFFDVESLELVAPPITFTDVDPNQTFLTDWRP